MNLNDLSPHPRPEPVTRRPATQRPARISPWWLIGLLLAGLVILAGCAPDEARMIDAQARLTQAQAQLTGAQAAAQQELISYTMPREAWPELRAAQRYAELPAPAGGDL